MPILKLLILKLKKENPLWGLRRIRDELHKLFIEVSHETISKILQHFRKTGDIKPTLSWKCFLSSHIEKKHRPVYDKIMYSTYTLNTDELTPRFITVLQQAYPGKKVEIVVQEAQDETEYLIKDPQLLKAVEDIKNGKNLVSIPFESL